MSPIITPDTSEAIDLSPIPPNTYRAKIVKSTPGLSKAGKAKLEVGFSLTVDGKEKPRTAHLPTAGEGAWGFDQLLRAIGLGEMADAYKNPQVTPKPPFDTDCLIGQELMVVIAEDMYNGAKSDKIQGYLKA